jgi:hypothetical protein
MGAPRSHQRTWADHEFFECFHSTSRSSGRDFAPSFSAHVRWCEHGAPIEIAVVSGSHADSKAQFRQAVDGPTKGVS